MIWILIVVIALAVLILTNIVNIRNKEKKNGIYIIKPDMKKIINEYMPPKTVGPPRINTAKENSSIIGAVVGDISGSAYEADRQFGTSFFQTIPFITPFSRFTDDTVLSAAVKESLLNNIPYIDSLYKWGRKYQNVGYGKDFMKWLMASTPKPRKEGSYGNGAAMRVSYIGEYYKDCEDVIREAVKSALPTHNHREGIKGAVVTAVCVWMAAKGYTKGEILGYACKYYVSPDYDYRPDMPIADFLENADGRIRTDCMFSVPFAVRMVYESSDYESCLRNALRLHGDTDTLMAIAGGIAGMYYGAAGTEWSEEVINKFLPNEIKDVVLEKR